MSSILSVLGCCDIVEVSDVCLFVFLRIECFGSKGAIYIYTGVGLGLPVAGHLGQ